MNRLLQPEFYTCYTRNNNVKDFLYQANYQNNICARLRSQGKSIGNANVTQIVFYHKCPNIGNFFIQKQGYHKNKNEIKISFLGRYLPSFPLHR